MDMENEKYCPLSMSAPADCDLVRCCEENCAWWNEDTQSCAVLTLAKAARKKG